MLLCYCYKKKNRFQAIQFNTGTHVEVPVLCAEPRTNECSVKLECEMLLTKVIFYIKMAVYSFVPLTVFTKEL